MQNTAPLAFEKKENHWVLRTLLTHISHGDCGEMWYKGRVEVVLHNREND